MPDQPPNKPDLIGTSRRSERLAWWASDGPNHADTPLADALATVEALMDHLSVGILLEDEHGVVKHVNATLYDLFAGINPFDAPAYGDAALAINPYFRAPERFIVQTRRQLRNALPAKGELLELRTGAMIERSYTPIVVAGHVKGHLWQYRDVSELRRTQRDLRLSEARHRGMLSAALDSIIIVDEQGRVLDWNRSAESTFGWARDEVIGQLMSGLIIPDAARDAHQRLFQKHAQTPQPDQQSLGGQRLEVEVMRRDGHTFPCEMTITRVDVDGRVIFTSYLRDITAPREAEAALLTAKDSAESANRAKSLFLASMSHEVRTPLNAIIGMTELVLDQPLSADQRRCLDVVKSSASALQHLMNDLLDLSRIEAERIEIEEVAFSPREVIDHVIQVVHLHAEEKGLQLRSFIQTSLPERLVGDPNRLRQVLLNLVSNAIKYTHQGSVTVTLSATVDQRRQRAQLEFSVRDTGVGVTQSDMERIFERFFRSERPEVFNAGGVGLGLSIARSLVELMGGKIYVQSVVGKGSEFFVDLTLPITTEMHRPASGLLGHVMQPDVLRKLAFQGTDRTVRVLLVEDHAPNRMLMESILGIAGYTVTSAHDGADAVARVREHVFHLILMDIQMPVLDGFAAAQQIRDLEAKLGLPRTPIIALTAHAMQGFRERCLESGMDDYLPKPIDRPRLLSTLATWTATPDKPPSKAPDKPPSKAADPTLDLPQAKPPSKTPDKAADPTPDKAPPPSTHNIDEDILALIPNFISRCLEDVAAMKDALAQRHFTIIQRHAHNIKGAGTPFGFPEITNIGRGLEGAVKQQNTSRIQLLIQELETFVQAIAKHAL
jgi:PAS domain S-box-containing protein